MDLQARLSSCNEISMQRNANLVIVLLLLLTIFGCGTTRVGRSPETESLLRAASAGDVDTVKALLASPNVDVNGTDDQGNTALIQGARFGHDHVVTQLLIARADPQIKNKAGKTALMVASEGGHDQTVAVLTQAGR